MLPRWCTTGGRHARARSGTTVRLAGLIRVADPVRVTGLARLLSVAVAALASGGAAGAGATDVRANDAPAIQKKPGTSARFTVVSPEIGQGKTIPLEQVYNGMGCKGKNISPALSWSGAPAGTRSFAILVHDTDAPGGGGFWHWVVYNIPPATLSVPAEAGDPKKPGMPKGTVQGRTDFGQPGYGGPCPPPGKPHHYHFKVFALKVPKLDVPAESTPARVDAYVNANKLAEAELVGLYGR